jgi:Dolichyl-phosphate-mannose-protein mannosyltransferase
MSEAQAPGPFSLRDHRAIVAIVLAFATIVAMLVARMKLVASTDQASYIVGAQHLASWDSEFHPPFYPIAIAAVALLVRDYFLAAKLVSLLAGILCIVSTYLIGLCCFPRRSVAVAGAAMVALSPYVILCSYTPGSDMLSGALFLASFSFLLAARPDARAGIGAAGALCGLAYLTRYVQLAGLVAAITYLLLVFPGTARQRLQSAMLYLGCFLLIITPWSAVQIARHGNLYNKNYLNIVFAMKNGGESWFQFREYMQRYPSFLSMVEAQPGELARYVATRVVDVPSQVLLRVCSLAGLFCIPGFFLLARRPTATRVGFILGAMFALAPTLLVWSEPRFYLAFIPFVMLAAAYFILHSVGDSLSLHWPQPQPAIFKKIPARRLVLGLCFASLATGVVRIVPVSLARANVADLKDVAEYIDRITTSDTAVVSHDLLNYYTRHPVLQLGNFCDVLAENLEHASEQVARAAAADPSRLTPDVAGAGFDNRVNVLVYSKRHGISVCPRLEFLLDPSDARVPRSFRVVYHTEGEAGVIAYWIGARQ